VTTVGVIANPAAGKDIRRLVAQGRVVSNQEKANTLRRVFSGIAATGVDRILVMPDTARLSEPARRDCAEQLSVEYLDMRPVEDQRGSTRAACLMNEQEVSCIVTLGGDGTNRVVALGCGETPLVPVSTGTNNVFPQMVEGTLAGLAAGAVATGAVRTEDVCATSKRLDVYVDGKLDDIALVDVAVSSEQFTGARAVWNIRTISEVFLTRAEAASIGLSSIGARVRQISFDEPAGLYLRLRGQPGENRTRVMAPVGPGLVSDVDIAEWRELRPGERSEVVERPGTLALDGERELALVAGKQVAVELNAEGPRVVQIALANELLARRQGRGEVCCD